VDLVRSERKSLIVLALTSTYLQLLADDVAVLNKREIRRLRLVGPRRQSDVPAALRDIYLPYDSRLNGEGSPIKGTESDFPQRAALHFVKMVSDEALKTPEQHKALVLRALARWPHKEIPVRRRLPENHLRRAIKQVLGECDGRRGLALRRLRDVKNIACEQKRFNRFCDQVEPRRGQV
jgi:hypothetical protein